MCRAAVIHNVDDIYEDCNGPDPFLLLHWRLARFVRAPQSHALLHDCRLKLMGSLCPGAQFAIESLRGPGLRTAPARRRIMLDVAFVALGLAALALMGVYALALRQL
jgi:hypothetical protein